MALTQHDFTYRPNQIGASEVSAILGAHQWMSPVRVLMNKRGTKVGIPPQKPSPSERLRMEGGKHLEELVFSEYQRRHPELTFLEVHRETALGIARTKDGKPVDERDSEVIIAHTDFVAEVRPIRGRKTAPPQVIEIKTYGEFRDTDDCPEEWEIQMQMELHALNQSGRKVNAGRIVSCSVGSRWELTEHLIEYDRDFCEQIVDHVAGWKAAYLDTPVNTPDEFESMCQQLARDEDNLVKLLGIRSKLGSALVLTDASAEYHDAVQELQTLHVTKQKEKEATKAFSAAQNAVRNRLLEHEQLFINGRPLVTHQEQGGGVSGKKQIDEVGDVLMSQDNIRRMAKRLLTMDEFKYKTTMGEKELVGVLEQVQTTAVKQAVKICKEQNTRDPHRVLRPKWKGLETVLAELAPLSPTDIGREEAPERSALGPPR